MLNNLRTNKILWTLTALCALAAAAWGALAPHIYIGVMDKSLLAPTFAQDLLTILVALFLLYLVFTAKEDSYKKQIIILGIVGSLFYLYGIYTIERVYNLAYYLYLAIFALAFWSMVYGLGNLKREALPQFSMTRGMAMISAVFSLGLALLFEIMWLVQLLPYLQAQVKAEIYYSIYILDLCLVMPAFAIIAFQIFKKKALGLLLAPAMFILGFFVIFPLGLGEIAKAAFGQSADTGSMMMSFSLSLAFLVLTVFHLWKLKRTDTL